jgi:ABC-2 type transport system permease protein
MFGQLRYVITKEFLTFFRDPATRRVLLLMPIVQLIVYAFAANLEVRNVNIGIINQDQGQWSYELIQRVTAASFVSDVFYYPSTEALNTAISHRKVLLALNFQADFSRLIDAGSTAPLQIILDGRRANSGQIAQSYLSTISAGLNAQIALARGAPAMTTEVNVRHWFNPNLVYRWFIVPATVAIMSMMTPLMMASLSIARERELGTFDQLLVAPLSSAQIIIGKVMPCLIAGIISGCLTTALAIFAFGIPFEGNMTMLLTSMPVFVLAITGYGLVMSSMCATQQQAMMGVVFSMIPFILTSGFITPVENMPAALQAFAEINPLKHFILIVQGSFLKSLSPRDLFIHLQPLLLIALTTLAAATLVLRNRMG